MWNVALGNIDFSPAAADRYTILLNSHISKWKSINQVFRQYLIQFIFQFKFVDIYEKPIGGFSGGKLLWHLHNNFACRCYSFSQPLSSRLYQAGDSDFSNIKWGKDSFSWWFWSNCEVWIIMNLHYNYNIFTIYLQYFTKSHRCYI